jgi:T5SS/PEP-CTERM-associated repeat protein
VIGDLSSSVGQATVSNSWNTVGSLTVGDGGEGFLTISDNLGNVSSADAFVARQPGSFGLVTAGAGIWTINDRLSIGGDADTATTGGNGAVEITGGAVTVAQDITVFGGGQVTLEAGSLDAPIIDLESGGLFDWTAGNLFVDTFDGALSNDGGTLAARVGSNSILVSGDYAQGPDGVLQIGIAGHAASNQYDSVIVGNIATLGGLLNETYTILDALNIGVGSFSNVANGERMFLNFSAGSFLVNYGAGSPFDPSQVVLSNFLRSADADFDDDGDIDGDDLTAWQGAYGTTDAGDADGDADSDGADFLIWQRTIGSPPATPVSAAVPEPATQPLILAALAACRVRRSSALRASTTRRW